MNTYKIYFLSIIILVSSITVFAQKKQEIVGKRTSTSKTFNNGDGSYTLEISLDYQHYKDKDGKFKEIQKEFVASNRKGYSHEVTKGLYAVYLKDNNRQTRAQKFVTRDGFELNMNPDAMCYYDKASGEYKIINEMDLTNLQANQNGARYKNSLKGIDLEYTYLSDRFKENIYLSQQARLNLPDPEKFGFKLDDTYLMFRAEMDYSKGLDIYNSDVLVTESGYETTAMLSFKDHTGKSLFYLANDLASFIPKDGDLDKEDEIPVLKKIIWEGKQQYVLYGVPLQWVEKHADGNMVIDPTIVLNTSQTCQDAFVYNWLYDPQYADNNYGSSTVILADAWTKWGINRYYRSYIQFDFSSIPADCKITGATLELTNDGSPHSGGDASRYDDAATYLRRVTQSWNESTITWNNQPNTTEGSPEDDSKVLVPAPANGTQSLLADVTNLVRDILSSAEGNNGFQLKLTNELKYRQVRYASQQHTEASRHPKLTINYVESDVVYYIKDHLGNIRVTIDEDGTVLATDDYYPFGLQMPGRSYNDGLVNNIYKYSGKELDEENGLDWYYFGARYYDPEIARWLAVDPWAIKYPSLSPYNYCANNPIRYKDPNGRFLYDYNDTWISANEAFNLLISGIRSHYEGKFWGSVLGFKEGGNFIDLFDFVSPGWSRRSSTMGTSGITFDENIIGDLISVGVNTNLQNQEITEINVASGEIDGEEVQIIYIYNKNGQQIAKIVGTKKQINKFLKQFGKDVTTGSTTEDYWKELKIKDEDLFEQDEKPKSEIEKKHKKSSWDNPEYDPGNG